MGIHFNWWQMVLLLIGIFICSIVSFPCSMLQKCGLNMKFYSRFLYKTRLEELSYFSIRYFKE